MKDEFQRMNLNESYDYFFPNSDVWTFGCIAYRLFAENDLFKTINDV
jgi:hypothetical protein